MIQGLPEKLKLLREKRGLSQKNVAKRLSMSPSIISSYETGERTPSVEMLLALSRLYRCSTDYLLGREALDPADLDDTTPSLDVDGLSAKQIRALESLIRAIRE